MVDIEYLSRLIQLLKKEGVAQYKGNGVELSLHIPPDPKSLDNLASALKKAEESVPPDLRADDTMNYSKILNWSGSPDEGEIPLPLTGEGDA